MQMRTFPQKVERKNFCPNSVKAASAAVAVVKWCTTAGD